MILQDTITLNNGVKIPVLALGTWLIEDDKASAAVQAAIKIGYRHIDTAQAYANECGVGEGIKKCGVPRENIFINSKVAAECKSYQSAKDSIDETLRKMGLDYIDMMIIHSPQPWVEVNQSSYRYEKENVEVWRAMEEAVKAGKVKTIGISNFLESDVKNILDNCTIRPAVNQVLAHIGNVPFSLLDYCKKEGIVMEAYSPIAHGVALRNGMIAKMAEKYGVSVSRLCIKYTLQLGMISLPKTANPKHMQDNADLNFTITNEDMQTLNALPKTTSYDEFSFFPVYGGKLKGYSGKPGTEVVK